MIKFYKYECILMYSFIKISIGKSLFFYESCSQQVDEVLDVMKDNVNKVMERDA